MMIAKKELSYYVYAVVCCNCGIQASDFQETIQEAKARIPAGWEFFGSHHYCPECKGNKNQEYRNRKERYNG